MEHFVIRGATVVDGSGGPPVEADVVVRGGKIAAVGSPCDADGARVVEAGGLVLAPGFIDIHGHSDISIFRYPGLDSKLMQGVTLEVTGNCGLSPFPVSTERETMLADYLRMHDFHLPDQLSWRDFSGYAERIEAVSPGVHLAPLAGHASIRIAAMGMDDREPSSAELALMERLLAEALDQGAWGLSTGLIYPPGSYARTGELTALARIAARYDGLCTSHIRNEGDGLMDALAEAVRIARESTARMQVSHLKALGKGNRGKGRQALGFIAGARREGVDISADQYPYHASATSLTAVVPPWALAGGMEFLFARFDDPGTRTRIVAEIDSAMAKREGASGIMIGSCRADDNRRFSGRTVAFIAEAWGCGPAEAVVRLLREEGGQVQAVFFSMDEEDVATILADPSVAVGSDGHGFCAAEAADESTHPRSYGTFPRVLGRYVREEKLLDLAVAVHKMTGLPASRLRLPDRGLIRCGMAADLVLFDPEKIIDRADYATPHRYPDGIIHVFMDGCRAIADGRLTGVRAGRVLSRAAGARGGA